MRGDLNVAAALKTQVTAMGSDTRHAVVHIPDGHETPPGRHLPLAGAGLAHKDIFVWAGRAPSCGNRAAPRFNAPVSPVIERLAMAGSTPLAALAMAEYASGVTGENPYLPLPVNPLGPDYAVGGSSSGSAVAVASGLCYGSLGTDTAGSVRIPAATCGIFALKPTNGVLEPEGCFPLAPTLDTIGVISRSALDAALLFAASLAPDQRNKLIPRCDDALQYRNGVAEPGDLPVRPWRLATVLDHHNPRFSACAEVRDAVISIAKAFSNGPPLHHDRLDPLPELVRNASTILHAEAAGTHHERLRSRPSALSAITRTVAIPGAVIPAAWYDMARRNREALRQEFLERYLRHSDVLLTPILPQGIPMWGSVLTGSPQFDPMALLSLFSWTAFCNYLGLPAVTFPVGRSADGVPLSIQAIGPPHCEAVLLSFAYQVERELFGDHGLVEELPLPHFTRYDSLS